MAIGTNDSIVKVGTQLTLESAGGAIANNTIVAAATAYDISANGNAPHVDAALMIQYTTAPAVNTTLNLYAAEQDIDSTNDEQVPTTTYKPKYICSFTVNAVTTAQYLDKFLRNVPRNAKYSLHNNGTGQSVNANWTLKFTPRTIGPSA
ncbi:MAG: hypothetical protein Q8L39_04765 [Burkholderiales bacterium]|nr:hypothetical protein [Burkholderiales bacterium]